MKIRLAGDKLLPVDRPR